MWAFFGQRQSALIGRAKGRASVFRGASVRKGDAVAGGGSLPGWVVPSAELVLPVPSPRQVLARLRQGRPPVFCRLEDTSLVFDMRTVPRELDDRLLRAIRYALEQS